MKEIEIKFKISQKKIAILKRKLDKFKDMQFDGVYFEKNIILDNKSNDLLRNGRVLRMRTDLKNDKKKFILTFKEPNSDKTNFHVREELSLKCDDAYIIRSFLAILNKLGFKAYLGYEKIREDYRIGETLISFYVFPILGFYLEIEGSKKNIIKISKLLGLNVKKAIKENWISLYIKYCKKHNLSHNTIFKF